MPGLGDEFEVYSEPGSGKTFKEAQGRAEGSQAKGMQNTKSHDGRPTDRKDLLCSKKGSSVSIY